MVLMQRLNRRFLHTKTTPISRLPHTIRQILDANVKPLEPISIHGWIQSIRRQKSVSFVALSDGTSSKNLQVVADHSKTKHLHIGDSVRAIGNVVPSPGCGQAFELRALDLLQLGACDPALYPLQKKHHDVQYLRTHAHLRPREQTGLAILRLRNTLTGAIHQWYRDQDFAYVDPPILTANDCEGAGEVFRITTEPALRYLQTSLRSVVASGAPHLEAGFPNEGAPSSIPEFFGKPTFLTVSTQLHLEALCAALSRVFTISPTFRAEKSQTHRHLSEFLMLEAEMAFTENLEDVMSLVENSLKGVMARLKADAWEEIEVLRRLHPRNSDPASTEESHSPTAPASRLAKFWDDYDRTSSLEQQWTRMTYDEAISELRKHDTHSGGFVHPVRFGAPLQSEHEKWLAGTLVDGPVFITEYPLSQKPFYMRVNPVDVTEDEGSRVQRAACFDLLVPRVGELAGGSLREERLDHLLASMETQGVDKRGLEWYVDLRKFGTFPHGGFGMGIERFVSWVTGLDNIRDCTTFPRWSGNIVM